MKIGILGYGKMGKAIEQIALERNHQLAFKISGKNKEDITTALLAKADVIIEFSRPNSAIDNIFKAFESKVPIVVGTTGWYDSYEEVKEACEKQKGGLLTATNFSVGVNLFFEFNKKLARVMNSYPQYRPGIKEIHHTEKLDAPSGTAITLGEGILENNDKLDKWVNEKSSNSQTLGIESLRIEGVPGTHEINYTSDIDEISIKHTAFNRKGFALGAVIAAEWMVKKQGVYKMSDVLKVNFD